MEFGVFTVKVFRFMSDVRDAVRGDAPAIAAIYNESIAARDSTMQLEPVNGETVERWIRDTGEREAVLVLTEGDSVVGYGVVKRYSDRGGYRYAAETSVYLRRARTGEGFGTILQAALIDRCRTYGYHHLVAKLWAENEPSRALHRKFGYELVGVQREIGYVEGEWRDVALMQKRLEGATTDE